MSMVIGTVEGTGAAITINCGFAPSWVKLFNIDGNAMLFWNSAMGDGKGQKIADSGAGTTDVSLIASGGVTPSGRGFIIGADADINVNAETICYEAGF